MLPETMSAVLLTGHGGLEKLEYRSGVPVPRPRAGEVLIEVAAAAINNTDINTRIGWYAKTAGEDSSWSGIPLEFPRIQGADVCGRIVAVGNQVPQDRIGERVLVRNMLRSYVDYRPFECWTFGSECDGGFAQYAVAPARETYAVESDWTDAELAAIPCAYSTAENMLHRASVAAERVLVTGASGGVGLAAVQLAKRRGATVIAVCSADKATEVRKHGADQIVERGRDLAEVLGTESVDVVVDLVGGPQWPQLLEVLRRGGRYTIAGAIGGPIAEIDLRTLYLKDLTLFGCTFQTDEVFENLIRYVEHDEIRPVIAGTYPLAEIVRAQDAFLTKQHVGKLVLVPPPGGST
ncbi:alcohol dehydrogenase family protein [Kribbella sp. NPDC050124]|uniref:alcohol dehydrogenase family protein n=1 Tax=Kribbella sp. NPDC050124 TaxID=3364114 RepID=UPI00379D1540